MAVCLLCGSGTESTSPCWLDLFQLLLLLLLLLLLIVLLVLLE